jgi:hypothetical protein
LEVEEVSAEFRKALCDETIRHALVVLGYLYPPGIAKVQALGYADKGQERIKSPCAFG